MATDTALIIIWATIIAISQLSISYLLYKYESSVGWGSIGIVLWFGINVYLYQIMKLEKSGGLWHERVSSQQRKTLRSIYLLVVVQWLMLFSVFGWMTSPGTSNY